MTSGPNVPRKERKRKSVELTLSDAARSKLDACSDREGLSKSAIVEWLIGKFLHRMVAE